MNQQQNKPHVLAIASGKGGVGKTNVAVNLALSLRLFGRKTLLIDADMGLANVDVLLGLSLDKDLRDVVLNEVPLDEVVADGPRGLKILPGASGVEELANLGTEKVEGLLEELDNYCQKFDYVVVDNSPGLAPHVIRCLLTADQILLVTNPEPSAITDAYALLKVLSSRQNARDRTVSVVVNRSESKEEAVRSYDRLRTAARRFLEWEVEYLGSVAQDSTVGEASRRQVDFLTHYASSAPSRDVRKIAARLLSSTDQPEVKVGRFFKTLVEEAPDE